MRPAGKSSVYLLYTFDEMPNCTLLFSALSLSVFVCVIVCVFIFIFVFVFVSVYHYCEKLCVSSVCDEMRNLCI